MATLLKQLHEVIQMNTNAPFDAITAARHINTYEVYTNDGYLLNILSTADKIKEYPEFKEIVTVGDVNADIIWLSAEDEELHIQASELWHSTYN
jgi:hypothetical protein